MICPNCKTVNDSGNVFCVSCGTTITQTESNADFNSASLPRIQPPNTQPQNFGTSDSIETSVLPVGQYNQSMPNFDPASPTGGSYPAPPKKRNWLLLIGVPIILLIAVGGGAAFLILKQNADTEKLPDHFGLFVQNSDKSGLNEIQKTDVTNALEIKNTLLGNSSLPELKSNPGWILYAENNDIPLSSLKLIEIGSITDDGSFRQVDFQAAPVEGKPVMKKIRVSRELATGKYAFAIFDGFFNEGKHRFWAFEIKSGTRSDNGDLAKLASVSMKPKEEKTPPPEVPPPPGSRVAYVTEGNVVMRSGPSQGSGKVGKFYRGQKVYVMEESSNYETFKNIYSNYARVQTTTGKTGWIYSAFLK